MIFTTAIPPVTYLGYRRPDGTTRLDVYLETQDTSDETSVSFLESEFQAFSRFNPVMGSIFGGKAAAVRLLVLKRQELLQYLQKTPPFGNVEGAKHQVELLDGLLWDLVTGAS